MKRVAITGANGQLGKQFVENLIQAGYKVYAFGRKEMDITDCFKVMSVLQEIIPDIVIHCAAYTKVDLAEVNKDEAFLINAIGARNVAVASEKVKAKLVYISTDYVFDGKRGTGYHEFDSVSPINVYGASKYAGEELTRNFHSRYFIVRTSWLYGKYGNNFVAIGKYENRNKCGERPDWISYLCKGFDKMCVAAYGNRVIRCLSCF